MIGLYDREDGRVRRKITYNGLDLNDPDDDPDDTFEINTVAYKTGTDYVQEVNQQRDGIEAYELRKTSRLIILRGVIRAPTYYDLFDKKKALAAAFDPAKLSHESPDDKGFKQLKFSTPTADTTTYPTGYAESFYYARALMPVEPIDDFATGFASFFDITLVQRDPRRYLQSSASRLGAGVIDNGKADYRSWPITTITMAGAGSATYKMSLATTTPLSSKSLTLDLSGLSNGDEVVVDHEHQRVYLNDELAMNLWVTGGWFEIEPGDDIQTLSLTNTTNATTSNSWFPAFCV